jgi:hypothetical protein
VLHGSLRRTEADWRVARNHRRDRRPAAAERDVNEIEAK